MAKRAAKRRISPLPTSGGRMELPGLTVSQGADEPQAALNAPNGMSPEELAYRTLLQEAILWATRETMKKYEAEIKTLAESRVKTLRDLRG